MSAEEVLNCISSAAATMKRPTPAKGKSYGIPPLQPEGVLDLDQQVRKRHTKKRKQQGLDPSTKPTQVVLNPLNPLSRLSKHMLCGCFSVHATAA